MLIRTTTTRSLCAGLVSLRFDPIRLESGEFRGQGNTSGSLTGFVALPELFLLLLLLLTVIIIIMIIDSELTSVSPAYSLDSPVHQTEAPLLNPSGRHHPLPVFSDRKGWTAELRPQLHKQCLIIPTNRVCHNTEDKIHYHESGRFMLSSCILMGKQCDAVHISLI